MAPPLPSEEEEEAAGSEHQLGEMKCCGLATSSMPSMSDSSFFFAGDVQVSAPLTIKQAFDQENEDHQLACP